MYFYNIISIRKWETSREEIIYENFEKASKSNTVLKKMK